MAIIKLKEMLIQIVKEESGEIKASVTNTDLPSEKVIISYEKRGNAENCIKDAR